MGGLWACCTASRSLAISCTIGQSWTSIYEKGAAFPKVGPHNYNYRLLHSLNPPKPRLVRTVERSVRGEMALRVQGVRTIQQSNANIVVTLLSSELLGETRPLVGSCLMREAPERSAALSVLKATNRLLGNVIFTKSL